MWTEYNWKTLYENFWRNIVTTYEKKYVHNVNDFVVAGKILGCWIKQVKFF